MNNWSDEQKNIFKQGAYFAGYAVFMVFVYVPLRILAGLLNLQD